MALISCPECGRENVSDSAEACPNCGYGIKAHFDKIKMEEEEKERARRLEEEKEKAKIEEQKREEERIKNVPSYDKKQLTTPIIILIISAIFLIAGIAFVALSLQGATLWFLGGFCLLYGVGFCFVGIYIFSKRLKIYNLSKNNLEAYQKQVIERQNAAKAMSTANEATRPECPYCHSHQTYKITSADKAMNIALFGVFGQKRKYQWHCNKCKSDF